MSKSQRSDLERAISLVEKEPGNEEAWDALDQLAEKHDNADAIVPVYARVLESVSDVALANSLGQRAVAFHEEWFGPDSVGIPAVLTTVLSVDPSADWAFQRLTTAYTVAEKWTELFGLYDKVLAGASPERKLQLLEEAQQTAKDLANDVDRSISYLHQLNKLKPDARRTETLAKLLEKHERWAELVELWEARLPGLPAGEHDAAVVQIAKTLIEAVGAPDKSLRWLEQLASAKDAAPSETWGLLEKAFEHKQTSAEGRTRALEALTEYFDSHSRPRDVVRLLNAAMEFPNSDKEALRLQIASRLSKLNDAGAVGHYETLFLNDPTSTSLQKSLRSSSQASGELERYARVLAQAADKVSDPARRINLLADAARTCLDLDDEAGAIPLFLKALNTDGITQADLLGIGRRVNELLTRTGQHSERLPVLEALAKAETVESSRKAWIGDIAQLAQSIGDVDRALDAWRTRLEIDDKDRTALGAMVALLEKEGRSGALIEALRRRASSTSNAAERRADLVRVAEVYERELGSQAQAIAAWLEVRSSFGDSFEVVDALTRLYTAGGKWEELAELLEGVNQKEQQTLTGRFALLGEAYANHLDQPARAQTALSRSLRIDPKHDAAVTGMTTLLMDPEQRRGAADALARAAQETGNWQRYLDLTSTRLSDAQDARARLSILLEEADIRQTKLDDHAGALEALCQAFALAPQDRGIEVRLVEAARKTDNWGAAVGAFNEAARSAGSDAHLLAHLRLEQALLQENEIGDGEAAFRAYAEVASLDPAHRAATSAVVRLGSALQDWPVATRAVCRLAAATQQLDENLLGVLETGAQSAGEFDGLCMALDRAANEQQLPSRIQADLLWWNARWHQDNRGKSEDAESALNRLVSIDNSREPALRKLADIEREKGRASLGKTLELLCGLNPNDLGLFREAAEVALKGGADLQTKNARLAALYSRASVAWRAGDNTASEHVRWAVEQLTTSYTGNGRTRDALDLLVEASRLPFSADEQLEFRNRAADMAVAGNDPSAAIEMYRAVLVQRPNAQHAIDRLRDLFTQQGRLPELLALQKHQLSLAPPVEQRLKLRLELAETLAAIEREGGRIGALRANLAEEPGHESSLSALVEVLESSARYAELLDALTDQATRLEERADSPRSAAIWVQAAEIAEFQIGDKDRAFKAHERAVDLVNRGESLDALARLCVESDRHSEAVPWLEKRLAQCPDDDRARVATRLARAHLGADRPERAQVTLERALSQGYSDLGIRRLLADLYRQAEKWQELADLLSASLPFVTDDQLALTWSVEASELYTERLKTPAKAVPALERAIALNPDNKGLRLTHAMGLRVAGRLDDARSILEGLISEFGRRRSPERAAIHVELAQVARMQGKLNEAVDELELATRMETNNAQTQKLLAEAAREFGNHELAEKTLRALLLLVRREPPGENEAALGPGEVFFEMHLVAKDKGDKDKAAELLQSVIEAAVGSEWEARRLRRALLAHAQPELLADILEQRLKAVESPAARAATLHELAEVVDRNLGDKSRAFGFRLEAMELAPQLLENVQRARKVAAELDKSEQFLGKLEAVTESLRRDEEQELVGELVMILGAAAEEDLHDSARAKSFYARAEQHRAHRVEALYALARSGSPEEQERALDELRDTALAEAHLGRRADGLYRLAELELVGTRHMERGLSTLDRALKTEPRYLEAAQILKQSADVWENSVAVLAVYESVARASRNNELLLDYLERQAASPKATPEQVREAVELAEKLGTPSRGEALLEQAIAAARASKGGVASAGWAVRALIRVRVAGGDLAAARDLLLELVEFEEWSHVADLGLGLARAAEKSDATLALAADIYEVLRQRDGQNRQLWEPLFAIYQRLGAPDRLYQLVMSTLPLLMDLSDRNLMRRRSSEFFLGQGKVTEAVELLQNALADDPDDNGAAVALENILRQQNDIEGLTAFLQQRFTDAQDRCVPETIAEVALQYGGLVAESDTEQARQIYASALEVAPTNLRIIRALLELTDQTQHADAWAELMSRRLQVEEDSLVPGLALALAAQRQEFADIDGSRQALEMGYRRNPHDTVLKKCLQDFYRDLELWHPLADMMVHEAEITPDRTIALARIRDAATIYRDYLKEPAGAARVLQTGWEMDRGNVPLVAELAAAQTQARDTAGAIRSLSGALETQLTGPDRCELLLLRSNLYQQSGDNRAAISDLETAFPLDSSRVQPLLAEALDAARVASQERGDVAGEREATLRLVEMSRVTGALIAARELLFRWIDRYADDREALISLRNMDEEAENWDGVIAACSRLSMIEEGDDQVDAALRLYRAAETIGALDHARPTLEHVVQVQPHRQVIREFLRHVYQETSARRELAQLLLVEAQYTDDEAQKYQHYRSAADIFVNELGDAESALPAAQAAQALRPDDHETVLILADVLTASGRTDEALAILEPAVNKHKRRSPELASLQHRMSRVHGGRGDQDTQLYWLKKAFDVDRKDGIIAAELAELATAIGDYELALKPLRAITLMDAPGPVTRVMALLWEAKIEHARGNKAKAELWAKKALREDPNFQEAAEFLAQIGE